MHISAERIAQIEARRDEVQASMTRADLAPDAFVKLSKEYAEIEPVARAAHEVRRLRQELRALEQMAGGEESDADPLMREMAQEEMQLLKGQLPDAERALALQLLPKDSADARPAMLEIRAGTGGDEAALFAGDLFRMYQRYADTQGWKMEMISANASEQGGFKEVVASINGTGVFAKLKFESGVHRVQRVPVTESGGRIHTSAATVAILPEPEEVDVQIADSDLKIDIYRASGAGGQHVNTTDSAVRITHLPTGIVVTQQDERSQHKNKAKAMQVLRARIYEAERERTQSEQAGARKAMVGSGDRSERIRTYNFPQGRVTDHRINLTLHRLPEILEGPGLAEVIDALVAEDEAARLAQLDGGGVSVADALRDATVSLAAISDTPRLDAELLMAHALGIGRNDLLLRQRDLSVPVTFAVHLQHRLAGAPIAHILGSRDFWTISLAVTPDVLIPRPDSETLIEAAVDHFRDRAPATILDLGTGSGALLLAALDQWPDAMGLGIDASAAALAVAQGNADRLGMGTRARFQLGDWAAGVTGPFDLLLINPPYIATDASLAGDVLHDPASALFAGADGLDDYRCIAPQLPALIAPDGMAAIEIGYDQGESVSALLRAQGLGVSLRRDLAGHDRCLVATPGE